MPDGTPVEPGAKFTKTWRLRNSGQVAWPTGLELIHVSGDLIPLSSAQPIPAASPGVHVELSVHLQVPVLARTGTLSSFWSLASKTSGEVKTHKDLSVHVNIVCTSAPANPHSAGAKSDPQKPAMAEFEWRDCVWRGDVVDSLGVFRSDTGDKYAGGITAGMPDGRAVVGWSLFGDLQSCELAAGEDHGYSEGHYPGGAVVYYLHEHGKPVHYARVTAGGTCEYDGEACDADHAGLVALKAAAQQAGVRPAPRFPQPRPRPARPSDRTRRRGICVRVGVSWSAVTVLH
jgi:hypothetical protein